MPMMFICYDFNHQHLLPFSCKRRHFCPTCHQKRVVVFGEELCEKVLKYVPHRQWVFSIPKRLRIYFMFDRKLLSKLSQCVWKVLSVYLKHAVCDEDADPGAVIAIHSFGDFLGFHPHAHVLITDGCFYGEGSFRVNPTPNPKDLVPPRRDSATKFLRCSRPKAKLTMRSLKI